MEARKELKIISLNTWGGQGSGILDFFKKNTDVDIFCLQEVYNGGENHELELRFKSENKIYNLLAEINNILSDKFYFHFHPHIKDYYGLAIFVKKDINVINFGEIYVHKEKGYVSEENSGFHGKNVQYLNLSINGKKINILNFHGLWTGKGKDDTEDRIVQSENIVSFVKTLEGEIILSGDFNLDPDTDSIKILENFGLNNLIKENNISTTRTSLYPRIDVSPFADYVFVSKDVKVKSFEIMPDEVSDHAAMKLVIYC